MEIDKVLYRLETDLQYCKSLLKLTKGDTYSFYSGYVDALENVIKLLEKKKEDN